MVLGPHLRPGRRSEEFAGSVRLDRTRCAAGDTVEGSVGGTSRSARVVLARVEQRPRGVCRLIVAETRPSKTDGRFALTVPATTLPTAGGENCHLGYLVSAGADWRAPFARLVVLAHAVPHVDATSWRADRLLRHFDARDFHFQLCEADLRGGGKLTGRVHRHHAWPTAALVVTARCMECWRGSAFAERGIPQWHEAALWTHEQTLSVDTDAHWTGFAFDLPANLPPAVEARTIAWRYELLARAHVHRWITQTAAITPLLHEDTPAMAGSKARASRSAK
jgi:hypothetical protein